MLLLHLDLASDVRQEWHRLSGHTFCLKIEKKIKFLVLQYCVNYKILNLTSRTETNVISYYKKA